MKFIIKLWTKYETIRFYDIKQVFLWSSSLNSIYFTQFENFSTLFSLPNSSSFFLFAIYFTTWELTSKLKSLPNFCNAFFLCLPERWKEWIVISFIFFIFCLTETLVSRFLKLIFLKIAWLWTLDFHFDFAMLIL